jgi:hypothetical protein
MRTKQAALSWERPEVNLGSYDVSLTVCSDGARGEADNLRRLPIDDLEQALAHHAIVLAREVHALLDARAVHLDETFA